MKFVIKCLKTGKIVSKPADYGEVKKKLDILNEDGEKYRIIGVMEEKTN